MKFDDEIVALQARVDALEARVERAASADAPAPSQSVEYTQEYLESLTDDEVGRLFVEGKIGPAQVGAAVTGRRVKANLRERIAVLEAAVALLPPEPEPVADEPAPEVPAAEVVEPATPEPINEAQIAAQDEHDHATGNVNELGQTPAEAVAAEAAAPAVVDEGLES